MDKDYTCFYCQNYMHLNPDTDFCCISGDEVYFDSHICENFVEYEIAT